MDRWPKVQHYFLFINLVHKFSATGIYCLMPTSIPRWNKWSHLSKRYKNIVLFVLYFRVRTAAHWVVNLRYFDFFIMLVILMSSITLAAEDPVNEKSYRNEILKYFDYAFTGVFTIEMVLKVSTSNIIRLNDLNYYSRRFSNYISCLSDTCFLTGNRFRCDFPSRLIFKGFLEHHGFCCGDLRGGIVLLWHDVSILPFLFHFSDQNYPCSAPHAPPKPPQVFPRVSMSFFKWLFHLPPLLFV